MKYHLLLLILFLGNSGCDHFPKDPNKTLEKVKNGTLVVGYIHNPPWVLKTDSVPVGIEPDLVKDFAQELNATIEWQNNTEENIFAAMEEKKVHLVIAGLTADNPRLKKTGHARPFATEDKKKHVLVTIKGENAFLVQLEQFLYGQEKQIQKRIQESL